MSERNMVSYARNSIINRLCQIPFGAIETVWLYIKDYLLLSKINIPFIKARRQMLSISTLGTRSKWFINSEQAHLYWKTKSSKTPNKKIFLKKNLLNIYKVNDSVMNIVRFIKFALLSSVKDFQNFTGNKKKYQNEDNTHTHLLSIHMNKREKGEGGEGNEWG